VSHLRVPIGTFSSPVLLLRTRLGRKDCQEVRHRADGRIREYTTPEDLPSSATYSQIRENTYYSKDKTTCYWPHVKNKKHQVTPQSVCPLLASLLD